MGRLEILRCVHVETEASVRLIGPNRYMRLPKSEAPRRRSLALDEALDDAVWHPHRGVFLEELDGECRLRIFPTWRPDLSRGIFTGIVVASSSALEDLVVSTDA